MAVRNLAHVGAIAGGPIANGCKTVMVGGIPVAHVGSAVSPHGSGPHGGTVIAGGAVEAGHKVYAEGKPVARIGDPAGCGHAISSGNLKVIAGV